MRSPKRFAVYWATTATLDIGIIIDYICLDSLENAQQFLGKIEQTASRLKLFPHRGRVVPELKEHGMLIYRELVCFPWRIIYRIEDRTVWVMAVIDGHRNMEDLLLERFLHRSSP